MSRIMRHCLDTPKIACQNEFSKRSITTTRRPEACVGGGVEHPAVECVAHKEQHLREATKHNPHGGTELSAWHAAPVVVAEDSNKSAGSYMTLIRTAPKTTKHNASLTREVCPWRS